MCQWGPEREGLGYQAEGCDLILRGLGVTEVTWSDGQGEVEAREEAAVGLWSKVTVAWTRTGEGTVGAESTRCEDSLLLADPSPEEAGWCPPGSDVSVAPVGGC